MSQKTKVFVSTMMVLLLVGGLLAGCAQKPQDQEPAVIKIGVPTPLSPPADYRAGEINVNTIKLAQKMINDKGGINGKKLELVIGDDEGKPATGVSLVEKMITTDKVSALVGVWHGSVALAQSEVAAEYKVPIIIHYSWPDEITSMHSDYVFRVGPFNSQIAMLLLPFLKEKGYQHVAIMAEDTAYGLGFSSALEKLGSAAGLKVTTKVFPAEGEDFTAELMDLRQMTPRPDLLIVASVYHPMYTIPRQAHEVGLAPETAILTGWDYPGWSPEWWEVVGDFGKDVMYPTFYHEEALVLFPLGEEFKRLYTQEYGHEPPIYAFYLFDAVMMLAKVMEEKKTSDPEQIAAGLREIQFDGTTGKITFERDNTAGSPVWNQWMGQQLFVIQYTEARQKAEEAAVIYSSAK